MTKKLQPKVRTSRPNPVDETSEKPATNHFQNSWEEQQRMIADIQGKIFKSPALNGGFDAMMFKMETLEGNSKIQGEKLDSIHEAIFHPDDGLYARVKENASTETVVNLQNSLRELQMWKEHKERHSSKDEQIDETRAGLINEHEKQLLELSVWKDRITSVAKWFVVSMAGAMIALIFKLIYELLRGHVQFV